MRRHEWVDIFEVFSLLIERTVLWILILCCSLPAAASPFSVFVSVAPQRFFVERIGGERVRVSVLVRPGHSPVTYEPTPKQMTALAEADVFVRIGVPFENAWMERIVSFNPGMMIIDAREELTLRDTAGHHHEGAQRATHGNEKDPHVWLSPPMAATMAAQLAARLGAFDPAHRAEYEANYRRLAAELDRLDQRIRALFASLRQRTFMVFHPAWGYFADAYDLRQVSIEVEGKEPGPRALARLIDYARAQGIDTVFVDSRVSHKHAATVANAIGGRVVAIDPLAEDYVQNLLEVARTIAAVNQ